MAELESVPRDAAAWRGLVNGARRRGDFLDVIDLARQGLDEHPGDLALEYQKTLAYARAGALGEAEANLRRLRSAGLLEHFDEPELQTDFGALDARLLKDRAFAAVGEARAALTLRAAAAYEAVYEAAARDGREYYFPAINAATLYGIGGNMARGRELAAVAIAGAREGAGAFWKSATVAEAQILLGNQHAAALALRAGVEHGVGLDELASTRRQLAWLCDHVAAGSDILAELPAPYLVCWEAEACEGGPDWPLPALRELVAARSREGLPVLAYGAIIGTADIMIAETLIAAGAQTNLVIACAAAACIEALAARSGPAWAGRLRAVLAGAQTVREVTLEGDIGEATVARMAAQQAQGLASIRAAALVIPLHGVRMGAAGLVPVALPWHDLATDAVPAEAAPPGRISRAFVFGDIKGFSTLAERDHRAFLDHVIGGFADALEPLRGQVEYTETAGDGVYVVLTDVIAALRCCHAFQQAMDPARLVSFGLPATLGLRLGAHVGPVDRGMDRVTGREKFIGKEVIRTARIEAITPVGQTYVTEQFAAILHSLSPVGHACEYVGLQAMAKGFGRCRMYSLRPTAEILALLHGREA